MKRADLCFYFSANYHPSNMIRYGESYDSIIRFSYSGTDFDDNSYETLIVPLAEQLEVYGLSITHIAVIIILLFTWKWHSNHAIIICN